MAFSTELDKKTGEITVYIRQGEGYPHGGTTTKPRLRWDYQTVNVTRKDLLKALALLDGANK